MPTPRLKLALFGLGMVRVITAARFVHGNMPLGAIFDAPYSPFTDPFPPDQHRFGPWGPIQEWLQANPIAARAVA